MEAPELACPVSPARIRPAPAPGPPGPPGGPASPHLTLGPVLLPPPEQGLAPAVFLKALPVPLQHTVPPGGLQPCAPLVTAGLDGGGGAFLLSPLLQPEGPGPAPAGKPTLAVSIVGALPVLSPGLGPALGSPGRVRGAGRYLCPHCGRDCLKPSVLEKHVRSHTGERPFPCATCGVAFKTQSNLYKHRRTQTHLNNARLSTRSDGADGPPEGAAKAGEPSGAGGREDPCGQGLGGGAPRGMAPSPGGPAAVHLSPVVAKSLEVKLDAAAGPGPPGMDREALGPAAPPAGAQPRWKLPEQKSPPAVKSCPPQQLQPQAASAEKSWEVKAPEGRLRKCESTDSGYLSRSDSAEQPLAPSSPLHGPWEHGAPAEGEGTPGPGERGASLELEKKQLEERIARLISRNQAVVDDPRLDHVRPRKSGLSKQGSIDLPAPHTYRGSFHFDIRARDPGRRRPAPLCPARSTLGPLDKSRPLFFHSVPTQLSTTVECVPVTRSNSLPFLEGTRTRQELQDPQGICPLRQKPLSPRPAPGPRGASSGLAWVGVPSGHPRALIRQAAVEDRPGTPPGDAAAPAEDPEGVRAARGRVATRKPQVFSQDKWQVYGNETFQRIYQKTKTGRQGGRKAKAAGAGGRVGPPLPRQEEAVGCLDPTLPPGVGTPVCGDVLAGAAPSPQGGLPASDGRVETRPPEQGDTAAGAGGHGQSSVDRAASPPALSCREGPGLGGKDARPPPLGRLERGCPPLPVPGPLDPESPGLVLPGTEVDGDAHGAGPEEPGQRAPGVLRPPGRGPAAPQPAEDKLPSERKKLKVEEQSSREWLEPLGRGAALAGPPQPVPLPAESRDSGPAQEPGGPRGSPRSPAEAAAPVALRSVGPGDTAPPRCPEPCAPSAPRAQAPGVLASWPDTAFAPKYLLRLPQGETPPGLPGPRAKDPRCGCGRPGERLYPAGPGAGPPLPPGPVSGPTPGGADCLDESIGVQEEDRGDLADTSTPTAGLPPSSTAEAHGGPVSFRTTPSDTQHLCVGSALPRTGPSGEARDPWVPSKELEAPPENALDDPPSGAHPRGCLRPSWPEPASSAHSETPWSLGAQGPFPTLRAEPRLTWCCLSRSLPLPAEQEGRAASVYLALHCPSGSPPGEGRDARPVSKAAPAPGGRSSTSQDGGGPAWLRELARPGAPGALSRHQLPAPERKTGPPRGRVRRARGIGKLSTLGTSSNRSRGHLSQSRAQRRACRLRPPLWVLRRDGRPGPPLGLRPRGSVRRERPAGPRTAGPHQHREAACATSEPPLRRGNGEREDDPGASPGSRAPGPSTTTVGVMDAATAQDKAPPAADCRPQDTAEAPGPPPPSVPGWAGTQASLPPGGRDLGIGSLAPHLPPPRGHVLPGLSTCVSSEAQGPPCASSGFPPCSHSAGSTSVPRAALGARAPEPQLHGWAAGDTLSQGSPRGEAAAEGTSPPPLPARRAPGPGAPGSVPREPAGKLPRETPAPGPGPLGSQHEEGRHATPSASGARRGGGPEAVPCAPPARGSGGRQGPGPTAPGGGVAPSGAGQAAGFPAVLSRTVKKRSLEGMRRQTRVEFRDSSSDDEDRLVIEI